MTWYRTGTVAVTNGSATVTLTGGDALANIFPDDGFIGPDGKTYGIATIGGAGSFTLQTNYGGPTASGQAYGIIPVADYVQLRDQIEAVNTLITAYQTIAINAGVGLFAPGSAAAPGVRGQGHTGTGLVWNGDNTLSVSVAGTIVATFTTGGNRFPDGTVGAPGISFVSDTNTGFYRAGADILGIVTGGTERVRVDNLGNVGINCSPISVTKFQIGLAANRRFSVFANGADNTFGFLNDAGSWIDTLVNGNPLRFGVGGTERARIDSTGATFAATANKEVRILSAAHGTIATPTGGLTFTRTDGGQLQAIFGAENGGLAMVAREGLIFATGGGALYGQTIERARINSSGDFGIGTNAPAARLHILSSAEIARFDTTTPRGSGNGYISIGDPSGRKGYFGFGGAGDDWLIANEMAGLLIFNTAGVNRWAIGSAALLPSVDNVSTLGGSSNRVSVVYAASGTINTSDEREKTWRGAPTKAELKAATAIIAECGFYQWNDAVATKGDDARLHFGVRAQRVWAIMAENGLVDPITDGKPGKTPYAFLCYDEWNEQTEPVMGERTIPAKYKGRGKNRVEVEPERVEQYDTGKTRVTLKAGNRYGVRTDQLIMFLMAAQEARIAALEERLNND